MPITLGSNIASLGAQRRLAETSSALSTTFERLSSGQRINRASDDAAGLAISDTLRARSLIYTQGVRNLNDGISLLNIADSAVENLSSIVVRLEELAAQAANGSYSGQQRKALDAEAQALSKEYFRISKATEFNGQRVLTELGAVNLQAGVGTNAVLSAGVGGAIGTGTFGARASFSAGSNTHSVTTGDFNGDGLLDLATADYGSNTTSVLLGLGNGTFSSRVSFVTGSNPYAVSTNDFNGDGVLDLVTADFGSSTTSVLLGVGNGTFSPRVSFAAGVNPDSVSTGDFNGDGNLDLVTTDYGPDTVNVLLGRGNGTFASMVSYALGVNAVPRSVATGDFNADGILDLATADAGFARTSVLLGLGNGTFGSQAVYSVGTGPFSVATGDLNGDGILDLVTADIASDTVSVLRGLGNGTFATSVSYTVGDGPLSVKTGDFNGDGVLDLVTANYGGGTSVLLNNGNGTFATQVSYSMGAQQRSVATGDFSGDGVLDFVTADGTSATASLRLGQTNDGVAPLLPFSLKTMADARQALPVFQRKREQLATQRGQIGAYQSRIGVAANVLQVSSENFRAAESRIRDADIAAESSQLVRLNILQQAASAVLAQANQQPALALVLLQA